MGSNGVMLLIIIICVILSGYFSATETAFSAINRVRIRNQAEKGNKRAALVLQLSDNYDSLLSTILIGNNIVNIGCSSLATILFVKLLGEEMGAGISTLVITVVVLIFGEISPKSIAKESPEKFAMFSAPMINGLRIVLTPINWMFGQWKKLLSCLFKTSGSQGITSEELFTIVEEAQEEGSIDKEEGSLLRSALSFDDLEAGDILTPRIDMEGIPVESTQEEAAEVFANTGYSRLPVYEETLDHIVGILYHKDFYNRVYGTDTSIREVMRPALFTTANQKIDELMQELQKKKLHIAIVLDEFGGTVGLITLEDILEELVGEIWDEHDEVVNYFTKIDDTTYIVDGRAELDKFFETFGLDKDEAADFDSQTVSGWIIAEIGEIPKKAQTFNYKNLTIIVNRLTQRKILDVKVIVNPVEENEDDIEKPSLFEKVSERIAEKQENKQDDNE